MLRRNLNAIRCAQPESVKFSERMEALLYILFPIILFVLSFISGMLGLGVAFISIPVLGLFSFDLKHVIMPWSLLLNGLIAISSAVAFTRSKMVDWRTAIPLLAVASRGHKRWHRQLQGRKVNQIPS